jgi:hypothetical protein
VRDERALLDDTVNVAAGNVVANGNVSGLKVPFPVVVQRGDVDAAGDENAVLINGNPLQRTLDTWGKGTRNNMERGLG